MSMLPQAIRQAISGAGPAELLGDNASHLTRGAYLTVAVVNDDH